MRDKIPTRTDGFEASVVVFTSALHLDTSLICRAADEAVFVRVSGSTVAEAQPWLLRCAVRRARAWSWLGENS